MMTRRELLALMPAAAALPAARAAEVSFERIDVHLHIQRSAPVFLNYRKVSIYSGSSEVQRNIISSSILGL